MTTRAPDTTSGSRDNWRERAACRNIADPKIFFPARSNTPHAVLAAAHCRACPVLADCLAAATDYGRTDGTVMAGHFWINGKPRDIPAQPQTQPNRTEEATIRRRQAIDQYYRIRDQHKNATETYHAIADQYGVSIVTVYAWHRQARDEHSRRLAALNQTARDAA